MTLYDLLSFIREPPFWNALVLCGHCPNSFRPPPLCQTGNCGKKCPKPSWQALISPANVAMPIYGNNTFQKRASLSLKQWMLRRLDKWLVIWTTKIGTMCIATESLLNISEIWCVTITAVNLKSDFQFPFVHMQYACLLVSVKVFSVTCVREAVKNYLADFDR